MRVSDPSPTVIPSFLRRAKARLAELARLLAALTYTEGWGCPGVRDVLLDAQRLRHGIRTLTRPGSLSLDEQRHVVERLLPVVVSVAETPPPPPADLRVAVTLTLSGTWQPGFQLPIRYVAATGANTPEGATLTVLRGATRIADFADSVGGAYRISQTDPSPGQHYTAELRYEGRLLGSARASLATASVVRYGAFAQALVPTDAQLLALPAYPAATGNLVFAVPTGRQRLYLLLPAGVSYKLIDPTLNLEITSQFSIEANLTIGGILLRQIMPVIGPFAITIRLELTA